MPRLDIIPPTQRRLDHDSLSEPTAFNDQTADVCRVLQQVCSVVVSLIVLSASSCVFASDANEHYLQHVKPVFKERCFACHGALKQEAGLRLDTGSSIRKGSASGSIIKPDDVAGSALLQRLTSHDDFERMPPEGSPLSPAEIGAIAEWIQAGATSPPDELPEPSPDEHWAFVSPKPQTVPDSDKTSFPWNDIDRFLLHRWQQQGVQPTPNADPATRLRRLYLDLTGLPPTPQQILAFEQSPTIEHWRAEVERLLSSTAYGERWGRHWMDVWRYADWYGRRQNMDVRNSAPQIWRWRDWIVQSLNDDKSYARMIQEMLAADEIAPQDDSTWPATGYLVRNYYSLNPNEWMRHNVEYTGKAFLALTFNCAHCHDHKYDPIAHDDYFRFRAFFEPLGIRQDRVVGEPEPPLFEPYTYAGSRKVVRTGMVRVFDERPDAATVFYTGGDERNVVPDRDPILPGVPGFLAASMPEITEVSLPAPGWYPAARRNLQQHLLEEQQAAVDAAMQQRDRVVGQQNNTEEVAAQLPAVITERRSALLAAVKRSEQSPDSGALQGQQSLVLDAVGGGRIVLHQTVDQLPQTTNETCVAFRCLILQDGHFNFQLARDAEKHLTALYVGFRNGQIRSYQPGGFTEFVVADYRKPDGGWRPINLQVELLLRPNDDIAQLRVRVVATDRMIVDDVEVALNGWDGCTDANQPITLDCHSGTRVVIDSVFIGDKQNAVRSDFESPLFSVGQSISGKSGWTRHSASSGSAFETVSATAADVQVLNAMGELRQVYPDWLSLLNEVDLARLRLNAAMGRLMATEATIAADNLLDGSQDAPVFREAAAVARKAQRQADLFEARLAAATAYVSPATDGTEHSPSNADESKSAEAIDKALEALLKAEEQAARAEVNSTTDYEKLSPVFPPKSTGRRTALAMWMTDRSNPLTARVAVNHIWMRHFHVPLVETVFDFGRNGKPPTHPALLDWLALKFMDHGWSMKSLHRLIVNSHAYSLSSNPTDGAESISADPQNRLLWHFPQGRMEAEVVRDSVLAISGLLDRSVGGPPLSNEQAMTTHRRGIYYERFPEDGGADALSAAFDVADPTECFRRTETIVPQQALALSNSKLIHAASEALSEQLQSITDDQQLTNEAFLRILTRRPVTVEVQTVAEFLRQQRALLDDESAVRTSLIRAIFNHNDFVNIR